MFVRILYYRPRFFIGDGTKLVPSLFPPGDFAFFYGEIDYCFPCILLTLIFAENPPMSSKRFVFDFNEMLLVSIGIVFFAVDLEFPLAGPISCIVVEKH